MPPTFAGIPVAEPSPPAAAPRFSGVPLQPRFDNSPKPIIFDAAHGRPQVETEPPNLIQPPNPMAQQPAPEPRPAASVTPPLPQPRPTPSPVTASPQRPAPTSPTDISTGGIVPPPKTGPGNPAWDAGTQFKQTVNDSITAIGQALSNVPAQWASIVPNLENMGAERLNEIVNAATAKNEGEAQNQQVLGKLSAMVSLKAQLERIQNEEKIKPLDAAPGSLPYYVGQIVGGTAEQAPGIIASIVARNPWPMLAFIGADQAGSSYATAREQGLDPATARSYAALTAGGQMALGAIPLHQILAEGAPVLRKILGSTVSQSAVSAVQTGLQTLVDKGFLGKDTSLSDAIKQMTDAGIIGAGTGFLFGLGSKAFDVAKDAVKAPASAAAKASADVFGQGVAKFKQQQDEAAFAKTLTGLPLEDRIAAFAQRNAEIAPEPKTSTPPDVSTTPGDALKRILDDLKVNKPAEEPTNAPASPETVVPPAAGKTVRDVSSSAERSAEPVLRPVPGDGAPTVEKAREDAQQTHVVSTPVGQQAIRVRPEVVDLADLVKASGELQPRDRSKLASAAQIEDIASNLNPADLMDHPQSDRGAPIVGPDNVVESGNGRVAAIKRAFEAYHDKAAAYRQAIEAAGYKIPPGVENPVLIRRRVSELTPEERVQFVQNSNRDNKLAMSPGEVARLDAKAMSSDTLAAFHGGSPADPHNSDFVSKFMGGLTTEERGQMVDRDGNLNSAGVTRMRAAVFAAAYDSAALERFAESTDDNVKAITGAMADAAGDWALMRRDIEAGTIDKAMDPTPHLLEAINLLSRARETAAKQGTKINAEIARSLDQIDLLTGESAAAEVRAYVEGFYQTPKFTAAEGRDTLADWLRNVVKQTRAAGTETMFEPAGSKSVEEIAREAKPKRAAEGQGGLFASRGAPKGGKGDQQENGKPQVRATGAADRQIAGRAVTQTPEFKHWFGNSKVVDEHGAPLVVYHGTHGDIEAFNPSMIGERFDNSNGYYFSSSPSRASAYADRNNVAVAWDPKHPFAKPVEEGANVVPAYLSIKNPKIIHHSGVVGESVLDTNRGEIVKQAKAEGHDGVIAVSDRNGDYVAVAFDPTQIKSVFNRGTFDPNDPRILESRSAPTQNLKYNPGPKHIPTIQSGRMPGRHASVLTSTGQMEIPEKPTFRDEPRKKLLDVIGNRLYQGKVKGRSRLGFYRTGNSEVRTKHYDDIEVMAHEAAHFLEFHNAFAKRFATLRKQYSGELDPLSYTQDPKAIGPEGFAEYVRLWSTQYAAAKGAAPRFTAAFEAELKRAGLFNKMVAFQKAAHRWYYQGELSQLRGKVGESDNFVDQIKAVGRARIRERFIQGIVDPAFAAKVIERETTGDIASAEKSPYKLYRMTVAAESMAEAAVQDGALKLEPDGSYSTTGKGIEKIFYPATKHGAERLDLAMTYFRARRAEELIRQGRERLFTAGEVKAGLALAKQHPEFEKMFSEWQQFNDDMLRFYTNMDLITPDMAEAFRERNKNYVPSHRIINTLDPDRKGTHGGINKRLTGGEQAVRETYIDILDSLHANIGAALSARAKSSLFKLLERSQEGSEFAAPLAPDSKKVEVAKDQQLQTMIRMLNELGYDVQIGVDKKGNPILRGPGTSTSAPIDATSIDTILAQHPEFMAYWQHNQEPTTRETSVEPVIIDGELRYFEVNSPLLAEMLTAPRETPGIVRFSRIPKRFLTHAITGTLQFAPPNLIKDTLGSGARSKSGFRPGYDSIRGFRSYVANDARFKAFRANGGLFAGRVTSQRPENKNAALLNLPARNGLELMGKALAKWDIATSAAEQGTRLGEFDRALRRGENPLEAAYRGRSISTDFAQVGRNDLWRWLMQITPFANAGLQGSETELSHMVERGGKVTLGKGAMRLAQRSLLGFGGALTAMSVALWLLHHDDDRYQGLTVDQKARFWWFFPPDDGDPITIPKPPGVGFIVGDLPEMLLDYVDQRTKGTPGAEGQLSKQLAFSLMQHFWFMDWPGIVKPTIEAWQNRTFTGAPVVPGSMDKLQGADVVYQRTDKTPELYRQMGKMLGVSPLVAQHYAQGFGGYLEQYLADASEAVLWNEKAWGPRPFARSPLDYVTHQFVQPKVPLRTKWTEGYYDLRAEAQSKAQAYSLLFKEHARDSSDFTAFTQSEVNLTLKALSGLFAKTDRALSEGSAVLEGVKYDPNLTQQQKEDKINAWYADRNALLEQNYKRIDALVSKLESGIK